MFFSVPYEDGWSATVNGEKAAIYKVNVGFMAVACQAGQDIVIRFDYMTPGLVYGVVITVGAVLLFVLYLVLMRVFDKRMRAKLDKAFPPVDSPAADTTEEPPAASPDNDAADAPRRQRRTTPWRYLPGGRQ